jgi:hypothetical protein
MAIKKKQETNKETSEKISEEIGKEKKGKSWERKGKKIRKNSSKKTEKVFEIGS